MSHDDEIDDDQLSALARQLDAPAPEEQRVEAMRASLLRAAAEDRREPKSRWPFVVGGFSAGAFAAAATVMMVLHVGHTAAPVVDNTEHRAQIEASAAADFERQVTHGANGTDEIVRLHAGRISVAVAELPHGDRVRVAAKDGEIEGEGSYEIAVAGDSIREVWVKEGSAHLRIAGQQELFLAEGQSWKAPVITADVTPAIHTPTPTNPPPASHAPASPTRAIQPSASPPSVIQPAVMHTPASETAHTPASDTATRHPTTPAPGPRVSAPSSDSIAAGASATTPIETKPDTTPAVPALRTMADASPNEAPPNAIAQLDKSKPVTAWQLHFSTGWQLLRAGKSAEAARELAAAADAGGDDPLAGDARYFEAVALTKAGRKTEAEHALVAFLDRSPHALRRGRASVMLGRLIAERGDAANARLWFDSATHDADPDVAAAAKVGLAGLK